MKRLLVLLALLLSTPVDYALAQAPTPLCIPTLTSGRNCVTVRDTNPLPVTGSFSATTTGFTALTTGTPISVTTGGVSGTLPLGAVVVATNVGATNGAYCALGASATTSSQYLSPGGGWFAFTVGASTQLTCITSTSTTTVNMTGGSGLPTGTGGGGGASGGGGAITAASGSYSSGAFSSGSIASGAYASGSIATGAMVDLLTMRGTKAPGTAASNSILSGGIYTAAGITLTDGQQAALQFTSAGSLHITVDNTNANGVATAANSSPVVSPILTNAGAAVVKGGTAVVNGGSFYQAVAASQTGVTLQSSSGATGDYLSHCVIYPTSTSPGVVTIFDNTNTAANSAILFPGGSTSLSNLAPISIPVGAVSINGPWKATTGANLSIVCFGKLS